MIAFNKSNMHIKEEIEIMIRVVLLNFKTNAGAARKALVGGWATEDKVDVTLTSSSVKL